MKKENNKGIKNHVKVVSNGKTIDNLAKEYACCKKTQRRALMAK